MRRFLWALAFVAVASVSFPACTASGSLGSDRPTCAEAVQLPPPPPATASPEVKQAYTVAQEETAKVNAAKSDADLKALAQATLAQIEADKTLSEQAKAKHLADVKEAIAELEAGKPKPSVGDVAKSAPLGGSLPDWILWAVGGGIALLSGGTAAQSKRLKAALQGYINSKYEAVVNGVPVTLTEAQVTAAAAATLGKLPPTPTNPLSLTSLHDTPEPTV